MCWRESRVKTSKTPGDSDTCCFKWDHCQCEIGLGDSETVERWWMKLSLVELETVILQVWTLTVYLSVNWSREKYFPLADLND